MTAKRAGSGQLREQTRQIREQVWEEPGANCPLCPRLVGFRKQARKAEPTWFNAPVPAFGDPEGRLAIVGLAPGLKGANRTGRPFTGDWAGHLLYATLHEFGFSNGSYGERIDDGMTLADCFIVNAVRCVPPENKPTPEEIRTCRPFLDAELGRMTRLRAIVALGRIAHDAVLRAFAARLSMFPFKHGAQTALPGEAERSVTLFDSYHCSRYNTNTGVLTPDMFRAVFASVRKTLDREAG